MKKILSFVVASLLVGASMPVSAFQVIDGEIVTTESQTAQFMNAVKLQATPVVRPTIEASSRTPDAAAKAFCWDFTGPLKTGDSGSHVRALHTVLEKEGFPIQADFNVYSKSTEEAVKKLQEKYAADILVPAGLTTGSGFVGLATRTKLTALYGCSPKTSSAANASIRSVTARLALPELSPEELFSIAPGSVVTVELDITSTRDLASTWGIFSAGPGNKNKNPTDFAWNASLKTDGKKKIVAMRIEHTMPTESWSTAKAPVRGLQPYPLVVVKDGTQLNSNYGDALWTTTGEVERFSLYGQKEIESFLGGRLVVIFDDNTAAVGRISADATVRKPSAPTSFTENPSLVVTTPNQGGVWKAGTLQDVTWTTRVISPVVPVTIRLRNVRTGNEIVLDEGGAMNGGRATVRIPEDIATGDYFVEVKISYDSQVFVDAGDRPILVIASGQNVVQESITCTFGNSRTVQKCYSTDGNWGCAGTSVCTAPISGLANSKVAWKSTCGGASDVILDGVDQELKFVCKSKEPYIKILSPNGNDKLLAGKQAKITWEIGNPDDIVGFYLLPINVAISNSLEAMPDSRSFTWDIPKTIPPGGDYKIEARLYRLDERGSPHFVGSDQSDASFFITGGVVPTGLGTLTVLSPNGNDGWVVGKSYTISFKGAPPEAPVQVYLERSYPSTSEKKGIQASVLIGEVKAGESTLSYTLTDEIATWPGLGAEYKVKVCYDNCNSQDTSDNFFSISSGGAVLGASTSETEYYISQAANVLNSVRGFFFNLSSFLK